MIQRYNPDYYDGINFNFIEDEDGVGWCRGSDVEELEEQNKQLLEALIKSRRSHYECEDCWYSCPKSEERCCNEFEGDECNCGADEWNNYVDAIIKKAKGDTMENILKEGE